MVSSTTTPDFEKTLIETDKFLTSLSWIKGEPTLK